MIEYEYTHACFFPTMKKFRSDNDSKAVHVSTSVRQSMSVRQYVSTFTPPDYCCLSPDTVGIMYVSTLPPTTVSNAYPHSSPQCHILESGSEWTGKHMLLVTSAWDCKAIKGNHSSGHSRGISENSRGCEGGDKCRGESSGRSNCTWRGSHKAKSSGNLYHVTC